MKKKLLIILSLFGLSASAQTALYHAGNMQLHDNAALGFHTNFINESEFETTTGLVGFYGANPLQISGIVPPTFYDLEIFVDNNLFTFINVNVVNNLNFIEGDLESPLNDFLVYYNFENNAFFTGENDSAKITGFAASTNKSNFSFPVGDQDQLRPLVLDSGNLNDLVICAYLFENPSNPASLNVSFDIDTKVRDIGAITDKEFWILTADQASTVTISWNTRSELANLANTIEDIILVGWSKSANQWIAIGNTAINGDLDQGFLVSETFVPNDFSVLTFGTTPLPTDTFAVNNPTLGNYFLSPNDDGINDFLVFDELENTGANQVFIFNKFGQKVFEASNYSNSFVGVSNIDNFVINRELGLPEGVYYYTLTLLDEGLYYQGFVFIDR